MSEAKELVFTPINFEEQKKQQPESLNYETTVMEMQDGKPVPTDDETGFMLHQYSQLAPKEIKKGDKIIASYKSSQRNYIKVPIFPEQQACLELEEQINMYDDTLDANRPAVFAKFDKLYTHVRSVKEPKEADDLDGVDPDAPTKPKFKSVKMRLEMGWNYYLDGVLLDEANSATARNAFFNARKNKIDSKSISVKLTFTDEDGNETTKDVKFADKDSADKTGKLVQEKDKILTMVMHRRPESIPADAKPVEKCNEKELVKYYGHGEVVKINTPDDLDKYYKGGCYVRLVYKPLKVYAQRNKNGEGKRNCSYIFELKLIDIINTKQQTASSGANKQYENYKFGRRSGKSAHDDENNEHDEQHETHTSQTTHAVPKEQPKEQPKSTSNKAKQVVVEVEQEDEVDGEEQEATEEAEAEAEVEVEAEEAEAEAEEAEEVEEEPVVVTKPVKGRTVTKVVVEEAPVKPVKPAARKTVK